VQRISARVSEELNRELDRAARRLGWTRAELVRTALERYLEDLELEWSDVRRELLGRD
jgi:predicted DNA-binding protein